MLTVQDKLGIPNCRTLSIFVWYSLYANMFGHHGLLIEFLLPVTYIHWNFLCMYSFCIFSPAISLSCLHFCKYLIPYRYLLVVFAFFSIFSVQYHMCYGLRLWNFACETLGLVLLLFHLLCPIPFVLSFGCGTLPVRHLALLLFIFDLLYVAYLCLMFSVVKPWRVRYIWCGFVLFAFRSSLCDIILLCSIVELCPCDRSGICTVCISIFFVGNLPCWLTVVAHLASEISWPRVCFFSILSVQVQFCWFHQSFYTIAWVWATCRCAVSSPSSQSDTVQSCIR